MAIANPDGSVIIDSSLNTDGIKKGFQEVNKFAQMSANEQRSLAQSLSGVYRKQGLTQSEAQKKAWQELKAGTVAAEQYEDALKDVENQNKKTTVSTKKVGTEGKKSFDGLQASLKKLVSYFISFQTVLQAIRFSGASAEFATQTEASVQRLVDIYGSASDAVGDFIDQNARALGMSKSAAASFSSVYGNLFSAFADQETNAALTNEYLQMTAVVASKTGRTVEDVQERIRSGLLGNTEAIEDLGIFVNVKTIEMTDAFQRMAGGKSWEQLDAYTQQQIRAMAILEQSTAKYGDEVADTSATIRNRFDAAYQDFQNTWGNIINTVLLPVLQVLTQIFNIATAGLNALSGRSGKILEDADAITDNSADTVENIEEQTDAQKALNKEMKKTLAGFDDIQILSAQTAENTSGGGLDSGLQGIGGDLGGTTPDGSAYVDEANAMLTAIMGFVSVAMVAIGVILLLTGHIGWGLGFIIAGAGLLAVTQASVSQEGVGIDVQNALTTALLIAGVAAIVIGIILCMCHQYVKGIALIALGASTVVGDIAINWDSIKDMLSDEKVATWVAIGGTIAIVLGILLCFAQQWWIGIGLIALGATALGVDIAVNWNAITGAFTDEKTAKWIALGGIVAIVLGILLCFAQQWAAGIGLIALGAATVGTVVAVNWDSIVNNIKNFLFENSLLVSLIASGLLVLGIILCVAGIFPLGVGLIAVGAAGLAAEVALHWDAIVTNIKNFLFENSKLIALISGGLLILGIILCATGVGIPLGVALIAAGAAGLVTVTALNGNAIVNWIKDAWNAVKKFWDEHIAPVFTLKWWTDLAKVCGNGLIAGFEAAVNGIIWLFESMINFVVDGLNLLVGGVSSITEAIGDLIGLDLEIPKIPEAELGRLSIPRLAKGAVIPGNREFLAVLGDQPAGQTNIEAPAELIKQMAKEAMLEMGLGGQVQKEEHYYLDETELMSVVYRLVRGGDRISGDSLVEGV